MALFAYFPNYVWNLSVSIAMESGAQIGEIIANTRDMHLDGILERITVPFLVTHGAQDRQIDVAYAHRSFEQLTASPRRELKIFTSREGGVEHVGADNMAFGRDYIADWFADTLVGQTA